MTQGARPEELEKISGTVESARKDGNGRWIVRLADGAVWRQIDSTLINHDPKKGSTVEIRTASLGSYFMKIDGQLSFRARREN